MANKMSNGNTQANIESIISSFKFNEPNMRFESLTFLNVRQYQYEDRNVFMGGYEYIYIYELDSYNFLCATIFQFRLLHKQNIHIPQ